MCAVTGFSIGANLSQILTIVIIIVSGTNDLPKGPVQPKQQKNCLLFQLHPCHLTKGSIWLAKTRLCNLQCSVSHVTYLYNCMYMYVTCMDNYVTCHAPLCSLHPCLGERHVHVHFNLCCAHVHMPPNCRVMNYSTSSLGWVTYIRHYLFPPFLWLMVATRDHLIRQHIWRT